MGATAALGHSEFRAPIGSDMEVVNDGFVRREPTIPPWESIEPTIYLETGRQALRLVSDYWWNEDRESLLVPDYLCDSMLEPFMSRNWNIVPFSVGASFEMDVESLIRAIDATSSTFGLLTTSYFGRTPSEDHKRAIKYAQSRGGSVVEDETHHVFEPHESGADFAVASLRKLLPLADGAYLRGQLLTGPQLGAARDVGRWQAMGQKAQALASGSTHEIKAAREAMLKSAELLEEDLSPRAASAETQSLLPRFDYDRMARIRVENAQTLESALADVDGLAVVNPVYATSVPSHVVLRLRKPQRMQSELAARGLFCAIHWPPSEILMRAGDWPDDIISVPIDHRYTTADMEHAALLIRKTYALVNSNS
jgi:hypothetical protein